MYPIMRRYQTPALGRQVPPQADGPAPADAGVPLRCGKVRVGSCCRKWVKELRGGNKNGMSTCYGEAHTTFALWGSNTLFLWNGLLHMSAHADLRGSSWKASGVNSSGFPHIVSSSVAQPMSEPSSRISPISPTQTVSDAFKRGHTGVHGNIAANACTAGASVLLDVVVDSRFAVWRMESGRGARLRLAPTIAVRFFATVVLRRLRWPPFFGRLLG